MMILNNNKKISSANQFSTILKMQRILIILKMYYLNRQNHQKINKNNQRILTISIF